MADKSKITWTDSTFNPWISCTKVSDGCKHCYAEAMMDGHYHKAVWGPQGTRKKTSAANWKKPVAWNAAGWCECGACGWRGEPKTTKIGPDGRLACPDCGYEVSSARRRVFCASLADVFEGPQTLPADWRARVSSYQFDLFDLITDTPNLDWLLLTKRPWNVNEISYNSGPTLPENVWIGTSVENQQAADERLPALFDIPAKVRFLSCEPLLGLVDLGLDRPGPDGRPLGESLHWIIGGGESGPHARPCRAAWAESLRDQSLKYQIPFHWKQWGEWQPIRGVFKSGVPDGAPIEVWDEHEISVRVGKHAAGRLLDGKLWNGFPGDAR